jgi:hypothetical protein
MAKRNMDWSIDLETGTLTCTHKDAGDKEQNFELLELFPDWADLDNIQKQLVCYGTKQKLADSVAAEKIKEMTANERIVTMDGIYGRLKDGIWSQKGGGVRTSVQKKLDAKLEAGEIELTEDQKALLVSLGLKVK